MLLRGGEERKKLSWPRYALRGEEERRGGSLGLVMLFLRRREEKRLSRPRYAF